MPYGAVSSEALTGGYKFGMAYVEGEDEEDDEAGANDNNNDRDVVDSKQALQHLPLTEFHFQGLVTAI